MLCLSYYLLSFLFNKIGKESRTGFAWKQVRGEDGGQWGEMSQTMYAHMNK
jgi:hypothetical protein